MAISLTNYATNAPGVARLLPSSTPPSVAVLAEGEALHAAEPVGGADRGREINLGDVVTKNLESTRTMPWWCGLAPVMAPRRLGLEDDDMGGAGVVTVAKPWGGGGGGVLCRREE